MASVVSEKLYPPTIGSSIPAFYKDDGGTATIAVPFAMNRAVSSDMVAGFHLKIKTVLSNTYLTTLVMESTELSNALNTNVAVFKWLTDDTTLNFNKIKLGQYLKVQMAYVGTDNSIGYFSTVGIIKYTSRPNIYIDGAEALNNHIPAFMGSYVGVYEPGEDKSERPYSYCFYLYDNSQLLVETTGWKLHNTSVNTSPSESLSLDRATDAYTFDTILTEGENYYIQYGVRTINNLEIYSPLYVCADSSPVSSSVPFLLNAENDFEEGYIELKFKQKKLEEGEEIDLAAARKISIEISRAEKTNNYASWLLMRRVYFSSYAQLLAWSFRDFAVEQGIYYKYCYRLYNDTGVVSTRYETDEILSDFEDMFLWDGNKQLKIRFNPKVSSFKNTRLEQKIDTIGSKFPFIFRNGIVSYKEFPISGLVSYLADNNELFIHHEEDLNIIINDKSEREGTPSALKSYETVATTSSIGYNMRAERRFKLKLLEWLGNGEIKYFKSPAEGNYLVRLLNVSLTPEDRVGRLIHTFNATAYEVEEINYNNLVRLGFISYDEPVTKEVKIMTISLRDILNERLSDSNLSISIKLNDYDIVDLIKIEPDVSPSSNEIVLRIGANSEDSKALINTNFLLQNEGSEMPDLYFNVDDLQLNGSKVTSKAKALELVGDLLLTYAYILTNVETGEVGAYKEVYMTNEIETFLGPQTINFESLISTVDNDIVEKTVLRFFVVNFETKPIKTLVLKNGNYYESNTSTAIINHFDVASLYLINNTEGVQIGSLRYTTNGEDLYPIPELNIDDIYNVTLTNPSSSATTTITIPYLVDMNNTFYSPVLLGSGVKLDCAYLCRVEVKGA